MKEGVVKRKLLIKSIYIMKVIYVKYENNYLQEYKVNLWEKNIPISNIVIWWGFLMIIVL